MKEKRTARVSGQFEGDSYLDDEERIHERLAEQNIVRSIFPQHHAVGNGLREALVWMELLQLLQREREDACLPEMRVVASLDAYHEGQWVIAGELEHVVSALLVVGLS